MNMTYKQQLLSENWKEKRGKIIERDNSKCTKCSNKSFELNFNRGVILGKNEEPKQPPYKMDDKFLCKIWTFQDPIMIETFISDKKFSDEKSYICYYLQSETRPDLANVVALQELPKENIELDQNFFKKLRNQDLNPKFTDQTKNIVLSPIDEKSDWPLIFNLHVHHTYYQEGLKAWEYPDESLVTLCWECHEELHKETSVPHLDRSGNILGKIKNCSRCHGAGVFPEYSHVYFGICFKCDGARYEIKK